MAMNTSVVLYDPQETSAEVKAVAGFLAGYSGRTREAYTLFGRARRPSTSAGPARWPRTR